MNSILLTCLFINLIVCINGASLPAHTSIDGDAAELTPLVLKVWSMTPDALKRSKPLVYCQVIDHCCGDEDRAKAISLMKDSLTSPYDRRFEQIMQICMNSTTPNKGNELCSSVVQSIITPEMLFANSDTRKYMNIISQSENGIGILLDPMESVCNSEEMHSLVCLSSTELTRDCVSKILQKFYVDDYQSYEKNVLNSKEAFTLVKQQLFEAFA